MLKTNKNCLIAPLALAASLGAAAPAAADVAADVCVMIARIDVALGAARRGRADALEALEDLETYDAALRLLERRETQIEALEDTRVEIIRLRDALGADCD